MFQANKTRIITVCAGTSAPTKPDIQSFLSPRGADQGRSIGEYLDGIKIDMTFCSTSTRAQGMLQCIMGRKNVETYIIHDLYFPQDKMGQALVSLSRETEIPSLAELEKTGYGPTLTGHSTKALGKISTHIPVQTSAKNWETTILIVGHPIVLPHLLLRSILWKDRLFKDPASAIEFLRHTRMEDGEALDVVIEGSASSFSVTVEPLAMDAVPA